MVPGVDFILLDLAIMVLMPSAAFWSTGSMEPVFEENNYISMFQRKTKKILDVDNDYFYRCMKKPMRNILYFELCKIDNFRILISGHCPIRRKIDLSEFFIFV